MIFLVYYHLCQGEFRPGFSSWIPAQNGGPSLGGGSRVAARSDDDGLAALFRGGATQQTRAPRSRGE